MNIKIFADGANIKDMLRAYNEGLVAGFTTNPTLMKKAGILEYEEFARTVLSAITDMPISFEVFSDDILEMNKQARFLSSLGENVYVKIPITNTKRECTGSLIKCLVDDGVKVNVTAIMTLGQLQNIKKYLNKNTPTVLSVFAGRIADTGVDPVPTMAKAVGMFEENEQWEVLWASPREVLNAYQAEEVGCDIITMTPALIKKLALREKNLTDFSLETVKMFYTDAVEVGYNIKGCTQ